MHIKPRKKLNIRLHDYFPMSFKGWLVFVLAMLTACATSTLFAQRAVNGRYVPLIFVLAVLVTAIMTDGTFTGCSPPSQASLPSTGPLHTRT